MTGDTAARFPGDSFTATAQARYLFGAPMGRAALSWTAAADHAVRLRVDHPRHRGLLRRRQRVVVGRRGQCTGWDPGRGQRHRHARRGRPCRDPGGARGAPRGAAGPRATLEATVTDVNRQSVSATASRRWCIRPRSISPPSRWAPSTSGAPDLPNPSRVMAVRPNGERVRGVRISGAIVRREWHQVHRERDGLRRAGGRLGLRHGGPLQPHQFGGPGAIAASRRRWPAPTS